MKFTSFGIQLAGTVWQTGFFPPKGERMLFHKSAEPTPTGFEFSSSRQHPGLLSDHDMAHTKVAITQIHDPAD